ncbi:hypothetical protein N3K66_006491 [Trichothecium roseum]|uniref:Uncharacterized protein n=1 Tax=Trichothecium roseum TaxID=47278 RepID=A0ACC0UVI6_9HYPO|nr:hypothetical protein N3K66_006491 [Trichothecium roseum]
MEAAQSSRAQVMDHSSSPSSQGGHANSSRDIFAVESLLGPGHLSVQNVISLLALLALLAVWFLRNSRSDELAGIPLFSPEKDLGATERGHFLRNGMEAFYDGSRKFRANAFRLTTADAYQKVIIPAKFLADMSKMPDSIIDIESTLRAFMEYDYTGIPNDNFMHRAPRLIKQKLTANLSQVTPMIVDESAHAIASELAACSDGAGWTPFVTYPLLLRIVAVVSGRLFVGPEMNRDEAYVDMAMSYATVCMDAVHAVKAVRPWLRPLRAPFLPEIRNMRRLKEQFAAHLRPVIRTRRETIFGDEDRPQDLLQAVIDETEEDGNGSNDDDDDDIADLQQALTLAAIHTTTHALTNVFFFLAAYPDYIAPLRQEIEDTLPKYGGKITFRALQDLKKLDSFVKESSRMEVTSAISFDRRAAAPFRLADGTLIPAGTRLAASALDLTRDPEVFPDPDVFRPFRFVEAREGGSAGAVGGNQFVSVRPSMLTFGLGRHACPGRFFAAAIIKTVVAQVIARYDVRLPEGVEGRYQSLQFASISNPDPTKEVLFKRI